MVVTLRSLSSSSANSPNTQPDSTISSDLVTFHNTNLTFRDNAQAVARVAFTEGGLIDSEGLVPFWLAGQVQIVHGAAPHRAGAVPTPEYIHR
jgi:hypothetical protein